jgi:hypothetical protein
MQEGSIECLARWAAKKIPNAFGPTAKGKCIRSNGKRKLKLKSENRARDDDAINKPKHPPGPPMTPRNT